MCLYWEITIRHLNILFLYPTLTMVIYLDNLILNAYSKTLCGTYVEM